MRADIDRQVRQFLADNFLFREDRAELSDTESLGINKSQNTQ